jgi:hypothetical protein
MKKSILTLISLLFLIGCGEEEVPPKVDIRPLIPGEYNGKISYLEYNMVTEEFDLNPNSFSVSAVIRKIDHPYDSLYEIEFSQTPADNTPFRFTLYSPCYINPANFIYGVRGYECGSYEHSANIHVQYERFGPCSLIPHIDLKDGGRFYNGEDRMELTIKRYYCAEPENSYEIEFTGSQMLD